MKNLFKNPLFYTNILLLALVMALAANTNITYAKFSSWISQTFAAVGPITGEGTVNFFTAFAGGSNQIGDSAIYQDGGGHIGNGTGASTFDSRLEILSSIDRFIELIRSGATYPTVFRQGTDGVLVVNNSNIDTLTLKGGNVGIGITGPRSSLEIAKSIAHTYPTPGLTYGSLHISDVGTAGNSGSITFGSPDSDSQHAGIYVQGSGAYGTKMYFGTTDAYVTGSKVRMMIDASGNVGIGTASPGAKLEVNGSVRIPLLNCNNASVLETDASGNLQCGADAGAGGSGLTDAFTRVENSAGVSQFAAVLADKFQFAVGAGLSVAFDNTNKRVTFTNTGGAGGSLPAGTLAGQTLCWDGSVWAANSNLFNNGTNIGAGGSVVDTSYQLTIPSASTLGGIKAETSDATRIGGYLANTAAGGVGLVVGAGNVGIGTGNPGKKLTVLDSSGDGGKI